MRIFATWWRYKNEKTITGNRWSYRLESWYAVSLSKVAQISMRTFGI